MDHITVWAAALSRTSVLSADGPARRSLIQCIAPITSRGQRPPEQDVDDVMLGGVHQRERHDQHDRPPAPAAIRGCTRFHRNAAIAAVMPACSDGNRGDQVDAGLALIEQRGRRVQVEVAPAARRRSARPRRSRRPGVVCMRAEQTAVGHAAGRPEHAPRTGRAAGDVGRRCSGQPPTAAPRAPARRSPAPANDSPTNNLTNAFHSSRLRSHSTPATTYGRMKNDM